ncbi:MAG: hypothetical protein V1688_04600 [bacterium]
MKKYFFVIFVCFFLLATSGAAFADSVPMTLSATKTAGLEVVASRKLLFGEVVVGQTITVPETSPNAGEVAVKTSPGAPFTAWFSASSGGLPTSQLSLSDGILQPIHHIVATNIGITANGQTAIGVELDTSCDSTGRCSLIITGEITAGDDTVNPPGDYSAEGYVNVILG